MSARARRRRGNREVLAGVVGCLVAGMTSAWMLDGILSALPRSDPRVASLTAAARANADAGLAAGRGDEYAGGHWLGSFATYLVTKRGVPEGADTTPRR